MLIINFSGQKQQGKDTAADYLSSLLNLNKIYNQRKSFAYKLKKIYADSFDKTPRFIEDNKTKEEVPNGFNIPVRAGLKKIGDEFRAIKSNVWIDLAIKDAIMPIVVLSDGRYLNELAYVKEKGGINILIWRPGHENNDPERSEKELKPIVDYCKGFYISGNINLIPPPQDQELKKAYDLVDYFLINDASKDDLYEKIKSDLSKIIFHKNIEKSENPSKYLVNKINRANSECGFSETIQKQNGYFLIKHNMERGNHTRLVYHNMIDKNIFVNRGEVLIKWGNHNDKSSFLEILLKEGESANIPSGIRHIIYAHKKSEVFESGTTYYEDDVVFLD